MQMLIALFSEVAMKCSEYIPDTEVMPLFVKSRYYVMSE